MTRPDDDLINVSEIAALAGTARSTVSNWKRRHPDTFPPERGRSPRGPLFDRAEIIEWLRTRSFDSESSESSGVDDLGRQVWALADFMRGVWSPSDTLLAAIRLLAHVRVDPSLISVAGDAQVSAFEQRVRELGGESLEDTTDAINAMAARLAAEGGKAGPDGFVPEPLVRLVAGILGPRASVLDPFCGAADLLVAAADYATMLCGQHPNADLIDVARGRLDKVVIGPRAIFSVSVGDAIDRDLNPLEFNGVACIPPFGQKLRSDETSVADPRWVFGPPGSSSESAWIQHVFTHLAPGGRGVIVLPASAAERGGALQQLRASLVRSGALRAVIQLPAVTFSHTGIVTYLFVIERPERIDERRNVLFGEPFPEPKRRKVGWSEKVGDAVVAEVTRWLDSGVVPDAHTYAVAGLEELAAEDFNLTPRRYFGVDNIDVRSLEEIRVDAAAISGAAATGIGLLGGSIDAAVTLFPSTSTAARRVPLSKVAEVRRGLMVHHLESTGTFPVHAPSSLFGGEKPTRFLGPDAKELQTAAPMWNALPGDLLVAIDHQAGAAYLVTEPMFASNHFAIIRPHGSSEAATRRSGVVTVDAEFLAAWCATPAFRSDCERYQSAGGLKRLSISDLASIKVPVPDPVVQHALADLNAQIAAALGAAGDLQASIDRLVALAGEATNATLTSEPRP